MQWMYQGLRTRFFDWLLYEPPIKDMLPYDFNRMKYELRPGDVLLVEGRSHVSAVIRAVMQSPWTHAVLYIGRLSDIEDDALHAKIAEKVDVKPSTRLIVEDIMGQGVVINPLSHYEQHHLRICRPIGITPTDLHTVIEFAIDSVGQPYNVRDLLDLMRFSLPWSILPRRWGSKLFRTPQGTPDSAVCSSLIANAFSSIQFPILPFVQMNQEQELEVIQRNPYLFTPKDFDYSPYFEIIKYPLFNPEEPLPYYRRMPWSASSAWHHDKGMLSPHVDKPLTPSKESPKNPDVKDPIPPATD